VPWHPAHICSKISLLVSGAVCADTVTGAMANSMVMIVIEYFMHVLAKPVNNRIMG
jgi:hypothetical protein